MSDEDDCTEPKKSISLWEVSGPDLNKHVGRNPVIYETAERLVEDVRRYFIWAEQNPLQDEVLSFYEGNVVRTKNNKKRVFTRYGLFAFLGISAETWHRWIRERPDLLEVINWVEDIMKEQKFTGAACGIFNSNLIARDMGLIDRREQTGTTTVVIQKEDANL